MLFVDGVHKFPKMVHVRKEKDVTKALGNGKEVKNITFTVTEKLDGANVRIYNDNGVLKIYSRQRFLADVYNDRYKGDEFRGFSEFALTNFEALLNIVPNGKTVYGEWLVKHTLLYPQEMYGNLYLFHPEDGVEEIDGIKFVPRIGTYTYSGYEELKNYAMATFEEYSKKVGRPVEGLVFSGFLNGEFFGMKFVGKNMEEKVKVKNPTNNLQPAYELIPDVTLQKRVHDTLDDMNLESVEELTKKDIGRFIGYTSNLLYDDFIREILPEAILSGAWKKASQISLKEIKSGCAEKVRDYLIKHEVI